MIKNIKLKFKDQKHQKEKLVYQKKKHLVIKINYLLFRKKMTTLDITVREIQKELMT